MNNTMLLSVVIPVGNLEKNYENLTQILINADRENIEIILVLDTDESAALETLTELCESQKGIKFKIIESQGRNPGSSRNLGILASSGEWLLFCDSDDFPYFTNILNSISEQDSELDILIGSYAVKGVTYAKNSTSITGDNNGITWRNIALNPGLWRWIIRRNFIKAEYFPGLSMGEDQYFLISLLNREPKIIFTNQLFYEYSQSSAESLTNSKSKISDLVQILKLELSMKDFPDKYSDVRNYFIIRQLLTLFKSGGVKEKIQVLILLTTFISKHSPFRYFSSARFVGKILKKATKI
jgi:glycosyltransferase involved in cell wall biosynthesis